MSKVAAIGDKATVIGFRALGLEVYQVDDLKDSLKVWSQVLEKECNVVFVTELVFEEVKEEVKELASRLTPAVLVIPSQQRATGAGFERMRKIVERAVGTDVLGKEAEGKT